MDQFIALIIIWAIIALLGQLTRKRKERQEKSRPAPSAPQEAPSEPEIPPIFREIFNLPPPQPAPAQPEPEPKPEEEILTREFVESAVRREKPPAVPPTLPPAPEVIKILKPVWAEKTVAVRYLPDGTLKKAVVWKEILDKPVSLRRSKVYR